MAYSKSNKEKIAELKANPKFIYDEYIVKGKSTYELAKEWGIPKSTVYSLTKQIGAVGIKIIEKITTSNESKFDIADPIFCYYAGVVAADGYVDEVNHRVVLRMLNTDWNDLLNKFRDYFEVSNTVKVYSGSGGYSGDYEMADLTISSKILLDELSKLNIVGRKKDKLVRFPDMSKLSDECQAMFMRGLMDGDGSIHSTQKCLQILEESELMIDAIRDFINSKFGFNVVTKEKLTQNDVLCYRLYINRADALIMFKWYYKNNLDYKLDYKYAEISKFLG